MKEYKTLSIIAGASTQIAYVKDGECQVEHEITEETVMSFNVHPIPPIYRTNSRSASKGNPNIILTAEKLKAA